MDNIKDVNYYIKQVIENIDLIIIYTENISYDEYLKNRVLNDAVMFRLIQMIESMSHISTRYKNNHPEIKWGLISGFRNGIVHNYGKTDYGLVFEIITKDIYDLKTRLLQKN